MVRIAKYQSIYNNGTRVCALVCMTLMYYIVSRSRGTNFAIQGTLIPQMPKFTFCLLHQQVLSPLIECSPFYYFRFYFKSDFHFVESNVGTSGIDLDQPKRSVKEDDLGIKMNSKTKMSFKMNMIPKMKKSLKKRTIK